MIFWKGDLHAYKRIEDAIADRSLDMLCGQLDSSSQEKRDQLYKKSVKNRYLVPKVASSCWPGIVASYCGEPYVTTDLNSI